MGCGRGVTPSSDVTDWMTINTNLGRTSAAGLVSRCRASVSSVIQTLESGRVPQVGVRVYAERFSGKAVRESFGCLRVVPGT